MVIYERRAQAVENERTIRDQEMETETQMEEKRKYLVELEGQNTLKEAEDRANALEVEGKGHANVALIKGEAEAKTIYAIGEAEADATTSRADVLRSLRVAERSRREAARQVGRRDALG